MAGEELIGVANFLFVILLFIIVVAVIGFVQDRRTTRYRKEMTDLYVSGRIRQMAEKDNIKLDEEYDVFKKWNKKQNMKEMSLGAAIESEMKEEIVDKKSKETKETKPKK